MKRLAIVLAATAAMGAGTGVALGKEHPARTWRSGDAEARVAAADPTPPADRPAAESPKASRAAGEEKSTAPSPAPDEAGASVVEAAGEGAPASQPGRREPPPDVKRDIERQRREDDLLKSLSDAASAHPDEPRYQVELLSALIDLDRIDEAVIAGEEIAARFPRISEVLLQYGRALARDGTFDLAKLQFQRTIALDAASAPAHAWIGRIDLARGERREAEASLRKALALDPAEREARTALAGLLERAGKYGDAIAVLEAGPPRDGTARVDLKGRWTLLREFEKRPPFELPSGFAAITVPMKRVKGLPPLVSVKIGEGFERLFVVDTGSDEMVLTPASARALGLPEKGTATIKGAQGREYPTPAYVVLDRISVSSLTIKRVPARVSPGLRYPVDQIGGVLGRDFLRRFRPLLDYPAKTLTLARSDAPPLEGVPFDLMGAILIDGANGNKQLGKFAVDTSSYTPGALDVQLVAAETGLTIFDEKVTALPEGPYLFTFTMPRLSLAGVEFRNFPATAVDLRAPSRPLGVRLRGILGHSLLRECRLEIDFKNQRLSLTRIAAAPPSQSLGGDAIP